MKNTLLCSVAGLCASVATSTGDMPPSPYIRSPDDDERGNVICDINSPKYRFLRLCNRIFVSRRKKAILERHSWYRTASGKWAHPHAMDYMTRREIIRLTPTQLEYKLKHGSQAKLPEYL